MTDDKELDLVPEEVRDDSSSEPDDDGGEPTPEGWGWEV